MATTAQGSVATPETQADRIRAGGGAGMRPTALEIMHQHELKQHTLRTDPKISDEYRREQLAALDEATDKALWAERDAASAAMRKPLEQKLGQHLGEILGTTDSRNPAETATDVAERHGRAMLAAVELQNDFTFVNSIGDVDALKDFMEELIIPTTHPSVASSQRQEKVARARKLAPVIVARLASLSQSDVSGANDAWAHASIAYDKFKKQHPSRRANMRDVEEQIAQVEPQMHREDEKLRETFRFGRHAQGMRL
jgi:hypothetical protein